MTAAAHPTGSAPASSALAMRLRAVAPLVAVLLAGVLALAPAFVVLARLWGDSFSYAHGWLVVAVSLYLLVELAPQLPAARGPDAGATALVALLSALSVGATYAHVDLAGQVLLPPILIALVAAVFGRPTGRAVAFPIAYVYLAIPVWDVFIPALQHLTVLANGMLLHLAGVPARISGDLVEVQAGLFEVAGGCSGVHFFIVAVAVSVLYGYLRGEGIRRALVGVALAVALALATNWLRVFVIILRGNATQMQTSLIHDHYWFGWGLFAGALVVYFALLRRLNPAPLPAAPALPERLPARPRAIAYVPGIAALALVLGGGYVHALGWARVPPPDLAVPRLEAPFAGPLIAESDFRPEFAMPAAERTATYQGPTGRVTYFQVAYTDQQSGRKLIGYGSSVVPDGWTVVGEAATRREGARGPVPAEVSALTLRAPSGLVWRVWSWYAVGERTTPSAARARLYEAAQAIGPLAPARQAALAAPCVPDCEAATGTLSAFAAILGDNRPVMTHGQGFSQ